MTDLSRIKPAHTQRAAYVYIRQSTPGQVEHNRESTARQYALADRACQLGWPREQVVIVDEDLGLSGSRDSRRLPGRRGKTRRSAGIAMHAAVLAVRERLRGEIQNLQYAMRQPAGGMSSPVIVRWGCVLEHRHGRTACNTPLWQQPNVTPRSLWLWSVGGGDIPQSSTGEAVYMGAQDNGTFATTNAGAAAPTWFNRDCCDAFDTVADSTQVVYTDCCFTPAPGNRVFVRGRGMTGGAEIATYPSGVVPGFGFPDVIARFGSGRYALITNTGIFITQNIAANPVVWTAL